MLLRMLAILLALPGIAGGVQANSAFEYPPQQYGKVRACLAVGVAERTLTPGLAQVAFTVSVEGPGSLVVEDVKVDGGETWKLVQFATSSWVLVGEKVTWSRTIRVSQQEPGVRPLPTVSLTFRSAPGKEPTVAQWSDILHQVRPGPEPEKPPPEPTSRSWFLWLSGFGMGVALVACVVGYLLWPRSRTQVPARTPEETALAELEQLEQECAHGSEGGEHFHVLVSQVLQRYLTQRFHIRAAHQTTIELLNMLEQNSEVPGELQLPLKDFFSRCDLAKFSGMPSSPDQCQRSLELARFLVHQSEQFTRQSPSCSKDQDEKKDAARVKEREYEDKQ